MAGERKVWIFFATNAFAGAENRFAGLWKKLSPGMAVNLVMSKEMENALDKKYPEARSTGKIFFLDRTPQSFRDMRELYRAFIEKHVSRGDILHFVEQHPLLRTGHRNILTLTASSMQNYNLAGRIVQRLGAMIAHRVDVLDPDVFKTFRRLFFFQKKKFTLTSNSYCELDEFDSLPWEQKKDWLVFVGRFTRVKQVINLLKAVPGMYEAIRDNAKKDLRFYFIGYGDLQPEINELLSSPAFDNVPITVQKMSSPKEVLKYAKVFFSVQLYNNYPSRALIEGMASGNIPVVTDNGQTRWLAKPEFSFYIPEAFDTADLVAAVKGVYDTPADELSKMSESARELVLREHTVEKMADYYASIYKEIAQ